jgi:glycosyltransferase involved in cell wall biosynthesis
MKPIVSVVMPVLNAAPYLADAIESILTQSLADLELIVVDDGSNDGSLDIAAGYARRDRRVRHIALPRDPRTVSGARAANIAFKTARGDYIARMDGDDISVPDRLALQLTAMRERELDVCGGQTLRFGDRNGEIWYPENHAAIAWELVFRTGMANGTMLARAAVLKAARYSENEAIDEYELMTRLIWQVRLGNCPETLLRLRVHRGQTTQVLRELKLRSRWGLRFRYFFRMFPQAGIRDFRSVNAVADGLPLADRDELEIAGRWLERLSRLPDAKLRRRMARRWTEACDRLGESRASAALRDEYTTRILAPPL